MPGPLHGVRIIELTSVVLGPWACQLLADMGADVIKVEAPRGDSNRALGAARNPGMAALYLSCNRNKRSLVLDLKRPAARLALLRLVPGISKRSTQGSSIAAHTAIRNMAPMASSAHSTIRSRRRAVSLT